MKDLVQSLSQKIENLQVSSDQKSIPFPTVVAGLDLPMMQGPPRSWKTLLVGHASSLQTSAREAASREKDVQGFPRFPVIEQRDAQGNLVRVPLLQFKQLKELKAACVQHGPTAAFTQTWMENIAL